MKYAAVVLLLALVCAGAHAQDYLASSPPDTRPSIVVSPLFIEPPAPLHISGSDTHHPGRGKMITGVAVVFAGIGLGVWGNHEVERGKEIVAEYSQAHPSRGLHPDGDGGGGHTIQFWGRVMELGGASMVMAGGYLIIRGAIKKHRFEEQYSDDYSPPNQQPVTHMSIGEGRALRTKISGMTMVGTGAVLQVVGAILYKRGMDNYPATGSIRDKQNGMMAFAAGTGLAVPGTFLWIKGARQQRQYKDYPSIHSRGTLGLYLAPMPTLCYRF